MKKTFLASLLSLSIVLTLGVTLVSAQGTTNPTGPGTTNPTGPGTTNPTGPGTTNPTGPNSVTKIEFPNPFANKGINTLFDLVKAIVNNIILPVGGVLCVLAFIFAGFKYVMAQGKPADLETANRTFLYAAIGTAVLLGSWVLANTVCNTIHLLGGPICTNL